MALDAESGVRMITEASRLPTSPLRRRAGTLVGSILLLVLAVLSGVSRAEAFDPAATARFARLALDCVSREYPNKITHELRGDGDIAPPRRLYPAFHGCFDWHSSVHGHWLLVRLLRMQADAPYAADARAALERNLTVANIEGELTTLGRGSETFERPYGLAWPGCCNSAPTCVNGTIRMRVAGSPRSSRSNARPAHACSAGCRN